MNQQSRSDSYAAAGVDITAGYKAVELMKTHIAKTMTAGALSDIGGFGGLFELDLAGITHPVLVSGTDGVGTKLKLAFLMDQHDTVGIDCVAMCVNDIICVGAKPLFFLDYIACGKNVPEKIEVKQAVFKQLDEVCPKHCYLNSNTSSLLMSDIYKDVSDERKAMTFSVDHDDPIRNSYLEMMWNPSTSEETKKAAIAHYHTLGFEPVITEREIKGYSINRVWRAVKRECLYLWANGYVTDVAEFDRGWMTEWHSNIGPFKLMDLIGLQTIYNIENSYYAASGDERDKPPAKLKEMIDAGHLGMKTGQGFYSGYDTEAGNLDVGKK